MVAKAGKERQEQKGTAHLPELGRSNRKGNGDSAESPITAAKRPRKRGMVKLAPGRTRLQRTAAKEAGVVSTVPEMALTPSKPTRLAQPITRAVKRKLLNVDCASEQFYSTNLGKKPKRKAASSGSGAGRVQPSSKSTSELAKLDLSEAQKSGPARAETPEHRTDSPAARSGTFLKQLLQPMYSLFRGDKARDSSSTSSLDTSPVERKRGRSGSKPLRSESPENLPTCEVNTLPVSETERNKSRQATPEIVSHESDAKEAELDSNDDEETSIKLLQGQSVANQEAASDSDLGEELEEQEDDYLDDEDYDPYLFIKILPPLENHVAPWRRCLLPKQKQQRKTLVLDLDETLVHTELKDECTPDAWFKMMIGNHMKFVCVGKRPHLDHFLEACAALYEVVVFTASLKHYADAVIDRIDPQRKFVQHRLFRDSCLPLYGNYMKDLSALGRDLSQTIIVDNSPQAYGYQIANGIPIESWYDDPNDDELLKMLEVLETLAKAPDVRPVIKHTFETHKLVEAASLPGL